MKPKPTLHAFLLGCSSLLAASSIHAASTWNAGTAVSTDGLWSTGTNWSTDTAPVDGADLIFDGADNPTNSNDIPLASIGSLTLNNAGWNITLGTLTLNGGIAAAGNATVGGILTLGAPQSWSNTTGLLTVTGTVNNDANLLTVGGAGNTTVSAILGNGAGGLTKDGAGTLTLSGANTYGGTTTLTSGTLQGLVVGTSLTPTSPLGTSSLSLNGGTLQFRASGTVNTTAETITLGNNAAVGGNTTIDVNRPGATSTNKTIQLGTLNIGANTLTVTGGNTYGVRFGATTATGAATFTANTGALTLDSLTLGDSITTGTTTTITVGGTGSSSIGPITNNTLDSTKQLALTKTGAGTARMPGLAYAFTGNISVQGGTLDFSNGNDSVNRTLGGGNYAGNIDIATGATFQFWRNTGNQEFSGVISGGGNVRLAYKGNYTLSGPNTYTGKTTVHGEFNGNTATLNVSSFNSVVSGSIVTGMGTLPTPVASSSLGAPINPTNGIVDIGRTAMQASAILNYTGMGETTDRVMNLVGSGNSQRKGVSNLGSGTLTFTSPWIGTAGVNNNTIPITTDADMILAGSVPDNFVALEKRGNAKLSLSGPCTIYNNVHLYAGTLEVDSEINDGAVYNNLPIGTGSGDGGTNFINVPAGTPIAVGMGIVHPRLAGGTTITAIVDINANPVVAQVSSNSDTTNRTESGYIGFKGALGIFAPAAANLRWLGNATLKYDGPNDSTNRNFTIDSTFTSTWEIITGSTLEVSGATTNTTGKLTKTGAGTLVLSGALLHDGVNNVDAGTLLINGNSSGMTGAVTVAANGTLGGSGTIGGATTVNGKLAPGNSAVGTLTFVTGGLTLGSLAPNSLRFELGADTTAGSTYDTVATNALDIGTLDFADFQFTDTGTLAAGTYTLISSGAPITGSIGTAGGTIGAFTGTLSTSGNDLILTVITGGGNPFDTWAATGTLGPVTFGGDTNGDGVKDGIAFLLGAANPDDNATGRVPTPSESGGNLILTFNCLPSADRGTAELRVAHSNTLASWTATLDEVPDANDAIPDNNVTFVVDTVSQAPLNKITATIDSAAAAGSKLFGRLDATE